MMDTTLRYMRNAAAALGFEVVRPDGKMELRADRRVTFESTYTYGQCRARLSIEHARGRAAQERLATWDVGPTVEARERGVDEFTAKVEVAREIAPMPV